MIEHLPPKEQEWLARFFASPNELSWSSLIDGSAPRERQTKFDSGSPFLPDRVKAFPLVLPFVRGGTITGWYATTQGRSGGTS